MILNKLQNKLHRYTHLNPEREGSPTTTSSPSQDSVVSPIATRNVSSGTVDFNNRSITPINFPEINDAVVMDPRMQTPVHTPVNNILGYGSSILSNSMANNNANGNDSYNPTSFLPPYLTRSRADSSTSLASSVSEFSGVLTQNSSSLRQQLFYQGNMNVNEQGLTESFTPQFVKLIMEIYQLVCSDPTITPFDDNNPPSGILSRVAKISIEQAEVRNIEIGYKRSRYLLTLIRKRLLQEIRKNGYLSRNASLSELPPPIQFPLMTSNNSSNNNHSNNHAHAHNNDFIAIEDDQQKFPAPDSFEATLLKSMVYQRTALLNSGGYISTGGDCSSMSTSDRFGRSISNSNINSNGALPLQQPQLLSETYDTRAPRNSSLRNDSTMFLLTPDPSEMNLSSGGGNENGNGNGNVNGGRSRSGTEDMIRLCGVLAKSASGTS